MNRIQVLYVDDEPINLKLFKINFMKKFDVLTAATGMTGLEVLDKHPDTLIIISDMRMPEMNGIEFIKAAKARFPEKKYYILTGFDITQEIQNAIDSGLILKYFRKPFNIKDIEKSIEDAFSIE